MVSTFTLSSFALEDGVTPNGDILKLSAERGNMLTCIRVVGDTGGDKLSDRVGILRACCKDNDVRVCTFVDVASLVVQGLDKNINRG